MRLCLALTLMMMQALPVAAQDGVAWVAEPAFDDAGSAQDGVVPLRQGGQWGLMGRDGQWVMPPQFAAMGAQAAGVFVAERGGVWGAVDARGQEVLPFQFQAIGRPGPLTPVLMGGDWLVLDRQGRVQGAPLAFDTLIGNDGACFTGTAAGVPVVEWRGVQPLVTVLDAVAGISAPAGDILRADLPAGGVANLYCSNPYIGEATEVLEQARPVASNMVAVLRGGLWGFDVQGVYHLEPIAPQFAAVRDFSEGLAPVQVPGGKWGYINQRGEMVIAPQFDAAFGHSDGIAGVRMGDLRGAIDRAGNLVVAPQFDDFWRHGGGVMPVKQGDRWGVIALAASDPQQVFDLPFAEAVAEVKARKAGLQIVPSTPHFYSGQDIQSRHDVVISPDAKVMLTVLSSDGSPGSGEVALWDRDSRKLVRKLAVAGVLQAVLLPGAEVLLAGTDQGEVVLLDAVTGAELHRLRAFDGPVGAVAVAPDGAHLAALAGGWLRIWAVVDGNAVAAVRSVAQKVSFAEDGQSVWLGDPQGGLQRVDLAGRVVLSVPGPEDAGDAMAFGSAMAVLRPDMALSAQGVLARVTYRMEQQADGYFAQLYSLEVTGPDGARTLPMPDSLRDVLTVDLAPDGRRVAYAGAAAGDYTAQWVVQDLSSGASVGGAFIQQGFGWVDRLRFTPEGRLVLIGGEGGDIREVEPETGDRFATYGAPLDLAVGTVVLPDATAVYAVNGNGRVLDWDMAVGRLAQSVETGVGSGVETYIGTDGVILGVLDGYDESRGAALALGTLAPLDPALATVLYDTAVIDGFGKRMATDLVVQARLQALPGQGEYVTALPMANGRFGLISETVGQHRLYDLATGALAATFLASPDGEWLVLTPEGFFSASEHGARLVSVSDGLRSFSVDQVFQALYRPDLVQAKLSGDPDGVVAAAAAQLDLTAVLGSGPAPRIKLAFPVPGDRAAGEVIDAGVELTDEGGGIGRVEWRVNGITADVATRAAEALGADDTITTQLALEPGRNVIEVVAYNAAGLIASASQAVVVEWDGMGATTVPALHVLAVGVNDYADGRLRLTYAAADARAFGDAVAKAGAGVFSSVNVVTLLDGQVTDAGLDAAFADLAAQVKPSDVFVFFLAGHGKTVEGEYHFIPADFSFDGEDPVRRNGIRQARWQEWMAGIKAKKSVMIYDTCESGSATGTRSLDAALSQSAAVQRLTRAMGRTILSASTDDAPALEGYEGHGVLTYALLSALESGDANGNATIEVTELAAFIDQKVPEFSSAAFGYRQVPQMSIKGSDFALGAQVAVLGDALESFPAMLTHVVAGGTAVLDAPGGTAVQTIDAGVFFGVFLIEESDGFARVAKDGRALGWVPVASLGRLQ